MWKDGEFQEVANIITKENWSNSEVVNFCIYFMKYTKIGELDILEKFMSS